MLFIFLQSLFKIEISVPRNSKLAKIIESKTNINESINDSSSSLMIEKEDIMSNNLDDTVAKDPIYKFWD